MTLCASTFRKRWAHRLSRTGRPGVEPGDAAAGRRGPGGRHRATPLDVYPLVRNVLEAHADAVCARLDGSDPAAMIAPISDDFVLALRAEAGDGEMAVSAALPLVTVAANLGELELTYPATLAAEPAHG